MNNQLNKHYRSVGFMIFCLCSLSTVSEPASATLLNASAGGTFTMNLDREAFANMLDGNSGNPGDFLVQYYNTQDSDYHTRSDSSFYLGNSSRTEVSALNLVHDITPLSNSNPSGQAANRHVKATTPNFSIDSQSLAGTGQLGMTGVELFRGLYSGALISGDYSLLYNPDNRQSVWTDLGQTGAPSGWYLQNNISFSLVLYDLANLVVSYSDANNWQLSGDLLISPEDADFMHGARLTDMGNFCLGVGSYSGCGQISALPVPAAGWLFATGISGFLYSRLRLRSQA